MSDKPQFGDRAEQKPRAQTIVFGGQKFQVSPEVADAYRELLRESNEKLSKKKNMGEILGNVVAMTVIWALGVSIILIAVAGVVALGWWLGHLVLRW